jgi:hypothetical protein
MSQHRRKQPLNLRQHTKSSCDVSRYFISGGGSAPFPEGGRFSGQWTRCWVIVCNKMSPNHKIKLHFRAMCSWEILIAHEMMWIEHSFIWSSRQDTEKNTPSWSKITNGTTVNRINRTEKESHWLEKWQSRNHAWADCTFLSLDATQIHSSFTARMRWYKQEIAHNRSRAYKYGE